MRPLLLLGPAIAAALIAMPAKADVDIHIGVGVPGVVLGTQTRPHHWHFHAPVHPGHPHFHLRTHPRSPFHQRAHPRNHFHPPLAHERNFVPPVFYPEKVYRKPLRHHRQFDERRLIRPPTDKHLRRGLGEGLGDGLWNRPVPPHVWNHRQWGQ